MLTLTELLILAQDATAPTGEPASAGQAWWRLLIDNALALTILFIFLTAIVSIIVNKYRKDKCLKQLRDYHVSYMTTAGSTIWGDLVVYSQGIELKFDAPHTTRRGLAKSSAMIYPTELANCLALCRVTDGLSDSERRQRLRQVRSSFRPGLLRRGLRGVRNMVNMLRDAFSKALAAIIGSIAKTRTGAIASQQGQVTEIGQTLLGAAANAYEPILEAHVGKPVIVRVAGPADSPTQAPFEMQGYLVDYTESYLAVFNVEHDPIESVSLELTESQERANLKIDLSPQDVNIICEGPEAVIVDAVRNGHQSHQLAVTLLPGCSLNLRRQTADAPVQLQLKVTRRLDLVCPRTTATVYFGADTEVPARRDWTGMAPQAQADQTESVAAQT